MQNVNTMIRRPVPMGAAAASGLLAFAAGAVIALAVPAAQGLAGNVLGNSKEPGRELGVVPERFEILVRAHKSFLCQLFGKLPAADHIINKADDGSAVSIEDQTKSFVLAASGARYEFFRTVHQSPGASAQLAHQADRLSHNRLHPKLHQLVTRAHQRFRFGPPQRISLTNHC